MIRPFLIGFVVALGLVCDLLGIVAAPVLFIAGIALLFVLRCLCRIRVKNPTDAAPLILDDGPAERRQSTGDQDREIGAAQSWRPGPQTRYSRDLPRAMRARGAPKYRFKIGQPRSESNPDRGFLVLEGVKSASSLRPHAAASRCRLSRAGCAG